MSTDTLDARQLHAELLDYLQNRQPDRRCKNEKSPSALDGQTGMQDRAVDCSMGLLLMIHRACTLRAVPLVQQNGTAGGRNRSEAQCRARP